MSTLCFSSVVGGCCGCFEGFSDELPGKHGAGGLLRQSCSTPAGPDALFHRSLDEVLISGEGRVTMAPEVGEMSQSEMRQVKP